MNTPQLRRSAQERSRRFDDLMAATAPALEQVRSHAVYTDIQNIEDVRCFMEHHVFAVWDFMSLLKALQARLTCVTTPWRPIGDGMVRRFVNELVLEEESDLIDGRYISHFEMYLEAMDQAGASRTAITRLLETAQDTSVSTTADERFGAAGRFIQTTLRFVEAGSIHQIAGAFTIGRENMIPGMFHEIVAGLEAAQAGPLRLFHEYLERHIELDGGSHGEMSARLLECVCGSDDAAWAAAEQAGIEAIEARIALWDAVSARITN